MTKPIILSCLFLLCVLVFSVSAVKDVNKSREVYIVYMGAIPSNLEYMPMSHHINILQEITGESSIKDRLVRSYRRSFNGFAARLSEDERERLTNMEGVVSVFPDRQLQLQTTTSWDFMGFKKNKTKRMTNQESNIIVGVIDSGIWPESPSFDDKGFGPLPKKWKGACVGGKNFTCNNKLIGARYYTSGDENSGVAESARDYMGHGSHTASTAAGNMVRDASFYGLGLGTARGAVPSARIAAYKVCDTGGCPSSGLLSAFDDAISDGVDVITISVGGTNPSRFERDPIAIGAFHAMSKGILTVNSAGNNGPELGTLSSVAPWMLTVAASNTNRAFVTKVVLGDGKIVAGRSVNPFDLKGQKYPLVYGKSASSSCKESFARFCSPDCLDPEMVKGKIVLCDSARGSAEAESAGAVGAIVLSTRPDVSIPFSLPVSAMTKDQYDAIRSYVNSTKNPEVSILRSEGNMNQTAPIVVSFSSRGPNEIVQDILKPDVTAPGVEILAAYSPEVAPSSSERDTRRVKYSVLSGTSMSCPHVAGAAAYLKTFHPRWSPSMIKSAIMTTAWPMNSSANLGAEFAYGSGHLSPMAAIHPGLVYEATKADHIALLCAMNYSGQTLRLISGENSTCTKEQANSLPRNLNYPSMSAKVEEEKAFNVTFVRTVTNVGMPNSTYKANIVKGAGSSKLNVEVVPSVMSLKSVYEKMSFTVKVSGEGLRYSEHMSASLVWSDGRHTVRSPIVIYSYGVV